MKLTKKYKIKVAITMGDPSGIGPAITLKALARLKGLADFVVIGDAWVLSKVRNSKLQTPNSKLIDLNNVSHKNFSFGKTSAEYGKASMEYLNKALQLLKERAVDCLVTCPISKEAINLAGFPYSGHTEFLEKKTHCRGTVMMLLNEKLKFSLVTRHVSLKEVPGALNPQVLSNSILLTFESLKEIFRIKEPRIVVCALNPHASDNGLMGLEENNILKPVLKRLSRKIRNLVGPLSSDVAIAKANMNEFDCVIAMYHDQALIPLKLCDDCRGVNLTLGLPFVRTSPLHGTAFDIAKTPELANAGSMIEAVKLAVKCTLNLKRD